MKCEHCGAEIPENSAVCPDCGKLLDTDKPREQNPWKLTALIAVGVMVLALVVAIIFATDKMKNEKTPAETTVPTTAAVETTAATVPADGDPDSVTCKGTYTVTNEEIEKLKENVVATSGDHELKNSELQIYYWMQFYSFVDSYGSIAMYLGLDVNGPLDTQINETEGGISWQQFFLDNALDNWHLYNALAAKADAEGFEMSAELKEYMENLAETMQASATANGFADADAMIRCDMGAGCSYEDYVNYLRAYYLGSEYFGEQYQNFQPTDDEVEAYFTENEAEYAEQGMTRDTVSVDVRHVLYCPDETKTDESGNYTEEAWEECRVKAQAALDALVAGGMTEEAFAALADTDSEDPGSRGNGGLYTGVTVGKMVQEFNDWCFDSARQVGDYGMVKTRYGYHLMYFCGSQTLWQQTAREDLISEMARSYLEEIRDAAPIRIDYSAIALGLPMENE